MDDLEIVEQMFEKGVRDFMRLCRGRSVEELEIESLPYNKQILRNGEAWKLEWEVQYAYGWEDVKTFLEKQLFKFTLVESEKCEVLDTDGEMELKDAGEFVFLQRKRSIVTARMLGIFTIVVDVVRGVVRAVTRNDVHLGIEMVMKNILRLPRYDSMLQSGSQVDYLERVYEGILDVEKKDVSMKRDDNGATKEIFDATGSVKSFVTILQGVPAPMAYVGETSYH